MSTKIMNLQLKSAAPLRFLNAFLLPLLIGLAMSSCTKEETLVDTENLVEEEVITPIHIDAEVVNGALSFKTAEAYFKAVETLKAANLASRLAWESKIGFTSMRSSFEEVFQVFLDAEEWKNSQQLSFVDYTGEFPQLKGFDRPNSNVLNEAGIVYVADHIGSVQSLGSFWILNGNEQDLKDAIASRTTNEKEGIYSFVSDQASSTVNFRTCTDDANDSFSSTCGTAICNNGTNRGSSALRSTLLFSSNVIPSGHPSGFFRYRVSVFYEGESFRRSRNRRNWNRHRQDHDFNWDFEVEQGGTFTSYSGQDTHFNNQIANITIVIFDQTLLAPSWWTVNDWIILNSVDGSGTWHTTNDLSPIVATHQCS